MNTAATAYHADQVTGLPLIHQGKVRDCFALGDGLMLIVASDRLSAFDVVLPDPIPGKGRILTGISNFWFARTGAIVTNHLAGLRLEDVMTDAGQLALLSGRAVVVRQLKPLPLEAIVRGYLAGSGWKDYLQTGMVCGHKLPPGLRQADRLPEVLFTPSSKAAAGLHDENISFSKLAGLLGRDRAQQVRDASIALYQHAFEHAARRGIIVADTKFEFGLDENGQLLVMDEMLTPDSSRFWPVETWAPGCSPPSYDKQYVRDYLETLQWNKKPPAPALPSRVIEATAARYREALARLTGPVSEDY